MGRYDRDRRSHPAPWWGPSLAADGRETPTLLAELEFAASLGSDPAPCASPTRICLNCCLPLALGHLNPLEAGSEGLGRRFTGLCLVLISGRCFRTVRWAQKAMPILRL